MIRAKIHVNGVETFETWYKGKKVIGRIVKMSFQQSDGIPENDAFWEATPSSEPIQIRIHNPEAGKLLEIGKDFYLDFTPTDEPPKVY